jgi:hypothetical protein
VVTRERNSGVSDASICGLIKTIFDRSMLSVLLLVDDCGVDDGDEEDGDWDADDAVG